MKGRRYVGVRQRWLASAAIAATLLASAVIGGTAPARVAAATSTWTNTATGGPGGGTSAAMAWDAATGTDVLLTTGGQTLTWNGTVWTSQAPAHSPGARTGAAIAYDAVRAQVVLFGGLSGTNTLNDTWTWNGTDWTQRSPSNAPPWRAGGSMAWDGMAQQVLLFGGFDSPAAFYNDTWGWDGQNWNELIVNVGGAGAAAPQPRAAAQMADDGANQTVVLFGGASAQGALDDTWVWTDTSEAGHLVGQWVSTTPVQSPPARTEGAFGYAALDGRFGGPVLFGGNGSSGLLQDTWTWDGSGWSQATPGGQPAARRGAVGAAGPSGNMVMFGGAGSGGPLSDTWTWSGSIDAAPLPAPTIVSCPPAVATALPTTSGTSTLRGAAAVSHPGLLVGTALTANEIYAVDAEQQITAGSQFNLIASSNQMYWSAVQSEPGVFNFCDGDQFVAYAQAYHQSLRYHNLIAGTDALNQSPNWVLTPTIPWTATSLSAAMKQWITTTIDHYRGKVSVYDVVNEAIKFDGTPAANVFEKVIGYPKYVEEAFQYANAANPQATLLYDDTTDWVAPKLPALENLVTDLHNTGSQIDAIGMEMFGEGTGIQNVDVAGAMATLAAAPYSVKTSITQITVPFVGTVTPNDGQLTQQANAYSHVMSACLAPASSCFMFMTWAVSDTYSLPSTVLSTALLGGNVANVRFGGVLFDATYQPRPAFNALLSLLQ